MNFHLTCELDYTLQDTAACMFFGNPELTRSVVTCSCADPNFIPSIRQSLAWSDQAITPL